jgi:uncharacterized SAM-binding protein YcdF (DUF218 family)
MLPELGALKPIATALALPPAGPLLLAAAGLLAGGRWGRRLTFSALLVLWLLSCNGMAVWLGERALPQVKSLSQSQAVQLRSAGVQAIVVLGGGVQTLSPEYGQPQPSESTAARLRYGFWLASRADLPLGFAGGVGWGNAGQALPAVATEASAAQRFAGEHGQTLRWLDAQSRDTAENAGHMHALLAAHGIRHIALVTHAWHMPRSQALFEQSGFKVVAAPMGFVLPSERPLLEWLPSARGLLATRQVLREWLALRVQAA